MGKESKCEMFIEIMTSRLGKISKIICWCKTIKRGITYLKPHLFAPLHNVQFVKYDVTVSFMAQVFDTVTYLVPQVLDTAS